MPPTRQTAPERSTKSPRQARSTWRAIAARWKRAVSAQFERVGERMDRVRRAMQAEETGEESAAENERRGSKELLRARRESQSQFLAGKWGSSREEQQRIVAVLKRATAEILGQ